MSGFRLTDDQDYRRGMVLGLTLAEMLILLVFLLLLSAAALLAHREREVASLTIDLGKLKSEMVPVETALQKQGMSIVDADNVATLLERGQRAEQVQRTLQATRDNLAVALQRVKAEETALTAARGDLAHTQSRLQTLQRDRTNLQGQLAQAQATLNQVTAERDQINTILQALPGGDQGRTVPRLQNFVGQYRQATNELARLKGNGGPGLPYCWASYPRGEPIYMLRITLHGSTAQDITVSADDLAPRPKPDSPAWGLLSSLPRDRSMPMSALIGSVGALKRRADELKCRYAVEVIDDTAATNKAGYKEAMNRLWGMFYLREVH
jgi:hypothetical protein